MTALRDLGFDVTRLSLAAASALDTGLTIVANFTFPARFLVGGEPLQSISTSVPASVELFQAGGAERLIVETADLEASSSETLNGDGALIVRVGGTVKLSPNTTAGEYRGVLVTTVQYN